MNFAVEGIGTELKDHTLAVPVYQRSYAWKDEEVTEFWDDLVFAFKASSPEYFLGTVVLTTESANHLTVIDGQQRLATAAILFAALRDQFKDKNDQQRATIVQNEFLSTQDLDSAMQKPKLHLNSEDAAFFEARIVNAAQVPAPTKVSHQLILKAYEHLRTRVSGLSNEAGGGWQQRLLEFVAFLRKKATLLVLQVPTDADAYLIFETLNDRGADLTIADLLKNYLFGHAGGKLNAVRDGWMQIIGTLETASARSLLTTFIRHYWSSVNGTVRERELYRSIKNGVSTPVKVVSFIGDLQAAAQIYAALLSSGSEYWDDFGSGAKANIESLLRLELEQNRPLLLAALHHLGMKEKKRLLKALVSWSVRGLIVGGIGGGTAENVYSTAAAKIRKGEITTAHDMFTELQTIIPPDAEFETALAVAKVPKASLARYFLLALERGYSNQKEPEFIPNANEDEVNLEHVLPKRAGNVDWGGAFNQDQRKEYATRLGNLALLQKGPNGKIGNKKFADKKSVFKASKFKLTKAIGKEPDWSPAAVDLRQKQLAKLAVKVWPREG